MRNALIALATLAVSACTSGGPTGTYSLDKTEMKATIDQQVQAAPEAQRGMVKAMAEMMLNMDIKVTLAADGKGNMSMSMPGMPGADKDKPAEPKVSEITWEAKDGKVFITDPAKPDKKTECKLDGKKLSCSDGKSTMVFVKA